MDQVRKHISFSSPRLLSVCFANLSLLRFAHKIRVTSDRYAHCNTTRSILAFFFPHVSHSLFMTELNLFFLPAASSLQTHAVSKSIDIFKIFWEKSGSLMVRKKYYIKSELIWKPYLVWQISNQHSVLIAHPFTKILLSVHDKRFPLHVQKVADNQCVQPGGYSMGPNFRWLYDDVWQRYLLQAAQIPSTVIIHGNQNNDSVWHEN